MLFIMLLSFMILTLLLTFVSVTELIRHHLPHKTFFGHQAAARPAARKTALPKLPAVIISKLPTLKTVTTITAVTAAKPVSQKELEKKLKTLEGAFSEGIISVKTYIEDKTKIENELKKIKTE